MTTKIPSRHFMKMLDVNVDNEKLDDKSFREFIRNTLPIVLGSDYKSPDERDNGKH